MNDQTLHDLLRHADLSAPRRSDRIAHLPQRVLRRRTRRRAMRASASLLVTLAVFVSTAMLVEDSQRAPGVAKRVVESAPTAPPLVFDDIQLNLHVRTAELLTSIEGARTRAHRANQRSAARGDVLLAMTQHRERAAMTLLHDAERSSNNPARANFAAEQYRRAIELFPDTSAAAVAQQRLKQLNS